jgi:hypothetical protein
MSHRSHVHVVENPAPGQVLEIPAGSRLHLRFPPRVAGGGWQVTGRPSHLVPLAEESHELTFLVFSGPGDGREAPLRLVRHRDARQDPCEVRELTVVCAS